MTYSDMQSRIADELARSDLTSQIQNAILSAILFYQSNRFWFNEDRSIVFTTVSGQEFYTSSDNASIPNLLEIDAITLTSNSNRYDLTARPYEYLEKISVNASITGLPTDYAYYNQQLRLYPVPNGAYSTRISALKRLTTLSLGSDTNAWTTDGEELIRCRAKMDLFSSVVRDPDMAQIMMLRENAARDALYQETSRRIGTGYVMPTEF